MRISDWSSDVCSSDLYAGLIALVKGVNGKRDRYDAITAGAKGGVSVALTGIDVEPTPIDRTKIDAALKALHAYVADYRSEEHTSELQSLMPNSYAVFCFKKKKEKHISDTTHIR